MLEMTGSVKLKNGQVLLAPFGGLNGLEGLEGKWIPSDQKIHPITPVPVRVYKGEWWSTVALEVYLKSLKS